MNWVLPTPLEWITNGVNLISIILAARNSVHTWWTGILGCLFFAWLFYDAKLYADMTLQGFFIATSVQGWLHWSRRGEDSGIRTTGLPWILLFLAIALAVTGAWAWALQRYTSAAAPIPDSAVLTLSVVAQLLLMNRRIEAWWFWIAVNTLSVPLYFSRSLNVTALFYLAFFINSIYAAVRWHRLLRRDLLVAIEKKSADDVP